MKRVLAAFTAVVIIAIGCIASIAGSTKTRAADEDNIREAVYRYQFQHNASGLKQNAKAYFLGIEKGRQIADPSDAFMKRFAGAKPPAKKWSQAEFRPDKGIVDKTTGERGLGFHTGAIKWISRAKVEVEGGYQEANLSASKNTYTLVKKGSRWVVTQDRLRAIS